MQKYIDEVFEDTKRYIENLEAGLRAVSDLPQMRGIRRVHVGNSGHVYVTAIYDMKTYRHNRALLTDTDWKVWHVFTTDDGWRYTCLEDDADGRLSYIMKTELEGSTCTRVKVGESVQPVFRVSCE